MNGCAETLSHTSIDWAERVLVCQEMPPEEISAILAAEDPEVVRRHLELHRERLEERLAEHLRELDAVGRELVARTVTH